MIQPTSNQSIPLRTQLAEVYGHFLRQRGHHIIVIILSNTKKYYRWNGLNIFEIPTRNLILQVRLINKIIKSEKCNIIQIRNASIDGLVGLFLKLKFGIPLVYQYTVPTLEYLAAQKRIGKVSLSKIVRNIFTDKLQQITMRGSDLILAISNSMATYLAQRGIPVKDIHVFHDGASVSKFPAMLSANSNERRNPTIIYVGTLDKLRNLRFMIHMFRLVLKDIPQAHLLIVGNGDDKSTLEKLVCNLGLIDNITFMGNVPYEEIPKIISRSDLGISPIPPMEPYRLSSPLKVFEYMAGGIPVVVNEEISDQHDAIVSSCGGISIPYDIVEFSRSVSDLLTSSEKRETLGSTGRDWVIANRNYENMAIEIERELYRLLRKKGSELHYNDEKKE